MENIKLPVGTKLYFRSKNGEILNITTTKTYDGSFDKNQLNDKIFEGGYIVTVKPSIMVQEKDKKDYRKTVFIVRLEDYLRIVRGGEDVTGLNINPSEESKYTIISLKDTNILGVDIKNGDRVILGGYSLSKLDEKDYVLMSNRKTIDLTKTEFFKFSIFEPLVNKDIIEIKYKDEDVSRKVVVTNIIYDKRMIEVFQLEGYSTSGKSKGIKNLYMDEVELVK